MSLRLFILCCFLFYAEPSFCFQANGSEGVHVKSEDFQLVKDADGVKIYHKTNRKKGYIEYKASTILNTAKMDKVLNFFMDYTKHPQWVYNCIESKIKEQNGSTYLYQICKSPWPLKNRDLSLKVETKKTDSNTVVVNFISQPHVLKKNTQNVRIVDFYSSWSVKQLKDKVLVTVYASFDPKLSLGNFMLKSYTTKIPFETLINLRALYHLKI